MIKIHTPVQLKTFEKNPFASLIDFYLLNLCQVLSRRGPIARWCVGIFSVVILTIAPSLKW